MVIAVGARNVVAVKSAGDVGGIAGGDGMSRVVVAVSVRMRLGPRLR